MNNRLYVGNLAFHTTEDTLQQTFSAVGTVSEAKLVIDRETGRSRGFAFVSMSTDEEAQAAIDQLNGADLDGRASASTSRRSDAPAAAASAAAVVVAASAAAVVAAAASVAAAAAIADAVVVGAAAAATAGSRASRLQLSHELTRRARALGVSCSTSPSPE